MNKKILHSVLEHGSRSWPDQAAIIEGARSITHHDLNISSDAIARHLIRKGVKKGEIVGVFIDISIDYVATICGISKAGAVFMPIDVHGPAARLNFMLRHAEVRTIVTNNVNQDLCRQLIETLALDVTLINSNETDLRFDDGGSVVLPEVDGDDASYLLFTSGSTGQPKAILGCQKSLSHFIHWEIGEFKLGTDSIGLPLAPLTFDVSLRDIFAPLVAGGTIIIADMESKRVPVRLLELLHIYRVTLVHMVPSVFRLLTGEMKENPGLVARIASLKHILLAGEALLDRDVWNWTEIAGNGAELVNLYGPSETTLAKIFNRIDPARLKDVNNIVALGKPISNTIVFLINDDHKLCGTGEVGEIYIKTPFASKGYYRDDELTKASFVQNPLHNDHPDIVYKTGDFGKWDAEQLIYFVGRRDGLLKIRGNRVEIAEVEASISELHPIKQSVVVPVRHLDEDLLVCYFVGEREIKKAEILAHLETKLPDYMHPVYFIQLDKFPLNANGKTDRKILKENYKDYLIEQLYEEPVDELEVNLESIWREVLGREAVGRRVAFFDAGGSSLKGIQVIARVFKAHGVLIKLPDLFANDTIAALAKLIRRSHQSAIPAIPLASESASYPLSNSQRRLWILSQFEDASLAYNMTQCLLFEGAVDRSSLEKSFNLTIDRHESLRTIFKESNGEPRQYILEAGSTKFTLDRKDISQARDWKQALEDLFSQEQVTAFDLSTGPLLRAQLIEISGNRFGFIYCMHHIISDGWSMEVLMREVVNGYNKLMSGEDSVNAPLRIQYKDYSQWQRNEIEGRVQSESERYWTDQFQDEIPVLEFPAIGSRPPVLSHRGKQVSRHLGEKAYRGLQQLNRQHGSTMFMSVLGAIRLLLSRYSGQSDIVIGTAVAGRDHWELEDQIGLYLNTLALRLQVRGDETFGDMVEKEKKLLLTSYKHQHYPFDLLVQKLNLNRNTSRSALFDVMVLMQSQMSLNLFDRRSSLKDIEVLEVKGLRRETSKFDLTFSVVEEQDGVRVDLAYKEDLYNKSFMEGLLTHLERLIEAGISNPGQPVAHLNYLSERDKVQLLEEFNATARNYPKESTLISLFEEQVKKNRDSIAIVYGKTTLTFGQLNERANQLGHYLRDQYHIKADQLIGIRAKRSDWLVIGLLGILKSGAAYVPVDPDYPADRSLYMIEDCGCKVLLQSGCDDDLEAGIDVLNIDKQWDMIAASVETRDLDPIGNSQSLCYVIYTSGSTGQPKGVEIEHRGVVNILKHVQSEIDFGAGDCFLGMTTHTFDISVLEIFLPLIAEGKLVLMDRAISAEPALLIESLKDYEVNVMQATPSFWRIMIESGWSGSKDLRIISGGEQLDASLGKLLLSRCGQLWNMYGPTETTIWSTVERIADTSHLTSIGQPISNTTIYILDNAQQLVPAGCWGEICIGGAGLARGYVKNPGLTNEKFIANPYGEGRIYRTGDIGRWTSEGKLQYQGRRDGQIKIRGHRVELSEIENTISKFNGINSVAVTPVLSGGIANRLAAYYTSNDEVDTRSLADFIGRSLPHFMVPSYFTRLASLPYSSSGKLDRRRLPAPVVVSVDRAPLVGEVELKVAEIWKSILETDSPGALDNFFESGGHSLNAIQLANHIGNELAVNISVKDVFLNPTIRQISNRINIIQNLSGYISDTTDDRLEEVTI